MSPFWRPRRPLEYTPASDGLDNTAWRVFADFVALGSDRDIAKLREMQRQPKPAEWQVRLAELYGIRALRCATGTAIGGRPGESGIHDLVVRFHPEIARAADFSADYVEDVVRQLWNFPPRATFDTQGILGLTGVTVGVLIADPTTDVDLDSVRSCVAARVTPEQTKRWLAAAGVNLD